MALAIAAVALCLPGRAEVAALLLGGVLGGPVRGLFYDPVRDLACTRCLPSPYAVLPDAAWADRAALAGGGVVTLGLVAAVVRRRSSAWATLGPLTAGASTTAYDSPHGVSLPTVWVLVALAVFGEIEVVVRLALARSAMSRVSEALRAGHSPEEALQAQLRDPAARVEFAIAETGRERRWVTATGTPVLEQPGAAKGPRPRHTTLVQARGAPLARLHHTQPSVAVTPELILSLEQAGLEAGLSHQIAELAASRTRMVERADAERRQLERDLHDGAQQYLLALAVELSLAESETETEPEGSAAAGTREALQDSRVDAEAALAELRAIARGVYPVLLSSGGLAPALQALGRRVGTTVTVRGLDLGVLALPAAAAVYGLVEELATSATSPLVVTLSSQDSKIAEVIGATADPESLNLERVVAAGGRVEAVPGRTVVTFP